MITTERRLKYIKLLITLAFIAGVLFSLPLWTSSDRFFPVIKPMGRIPDIVFPYDIILLLIFGLFSLLWIKKDKQAYGFIAIGNLLLVLSQDQMRWQPWVYIYLLLLLPFLPERKITRESVLKSLQWIFAGVYVWSGIQKLNPNFIEGTFIQIMAALDIKALPFSGNIGYTLPILEISMGLSLFVPYIRKWGVVSITMMHIGILCYLIITLKGYNSIVYPWNVIMIMLAYLLFWNVEGVLFFSVKNLRLWNAIPVIMVWILPVLNFRQHWDHYLSFSLYSDKPSNFYIAVEQSQIANIDKRFKNHFVEIGGMEGGALISIDKWSLAELNVPFYPELSTFKKLSATFCKLNIPNDKLYFIEMSGPTTKPSFNMFTCKELATK